MAKVTMPQLGESVAEGTIGKWLKQVGDHVAKYEPLLEVITDKVTPRFRRRSREFSRRSSSRKVRRSPTTPKSR